MTQTPKKILLVADYGKDDLAFKEVQQKLYEIAAQNNQRITIDIVSVEAFDTAQTAAVVAQAAEDGRYDLIYHNTAPRRDVSKARINNDGEGLSYARYENKHGKDVDIIGVNSGDHISINTFSLLPKERLLSPKDGLPEGVYKVKSATDGSQFRSRDVFPKHVIKALVGTVELGERFIPPAPKNEARPLPEETQLRRYQYEQSEKHPADAGKENTRLPFARAKAQELLADAYASQYAKHGDAARAYITVVGARSTLDNIFQNDAGHFANAEVDGLALRRKKSTRQLSHPATSDWIETGFLAAQLALNSTQGAKRTLVALPYSTESLEQADNLYVAHLDNGTRLIAGAPEALFFAREHIADVKRFSKEGRNIALDKTGAVIVTGNAQDTVAGDFSKHTIREKLAALSLPHTATPVYVDGFGNIKLSVRHRDLTGQLNITDTPGERSIATVALNGAVKDAYIATGLFSVKKDDLAITRGSSGWPHGRGDKPNEDNFAEIIHRGFSASSLFNRPRPGDAADIRYKGMQTHAPGPTVGNGRRQIEQPAVHIGVK